MCIYVKLCIRMYVCVYIYIYICMYVRNRLPWSDSPVFEEPSAPVLFRDKVV